MTALSPAPTPSTPRTPPTPTGPVLFWALVGCLIAPLVGTVLALGSIFSIWTPPTEEQVRGMYPPLLGALAVDVVSAAICLVLTIRGSDAPGHRARVTLTALALLSILGWSVLASGFIRANPLPEVAAAQQRDAAVQAEQRAQEVQRSERMNQQAHAERDAANATRFAEITPGTEATMERSRTLLADTLGPLIADDFPTAAQVERAVLGAGYASDAVVITTLQPDEPRVTWVTVTLPDGCLEASMLEMDHAAYVTASDFSRFGDCIHH